MTEQLSRCSLRSLGFDESLRGTASTVRSWLLLEQPGAWSRDALLDDRLPDRLGPRLHALGQQHGVKVLLVRRHGRGATSLRRTCFLARTDPRGSWLERVRLPAAEAVFDLDLAALVRGERLGLTPVTDPLFLVCTHGKHDPCCAERGRPVAAALAARFPDATWESSHIGGDRFAANVVCLPDGIYLGRLDAEEAVAAAEAHAAGSLDLRHFRGRSCYPFPVQAAEAFLREQRALTGLDDVRLLGSEQTGDTLRARFADGTGRVFLVRVRTRGAEQAWRLSCHDGADTLPPAYELLELVEG